VAAVIAIRPALRWRCAGAALAAVAAWAAGAAAQAQGPAQTIEKVRPSIVAVGTLQAMRQPQFRFAGTGFAVGDGSLVATSAHVIPVALDAGQDPEQLVVVLPSRQASERILRRARVVSTTTDKDLALLRIDGPALPPLTLGESDRVRDGENFLFTGFPVGGALGLVPVTHRAMIGAVTPIVLPAATANQLDPRAIRQTQSGAFDIYQLDAVAYPGNSGSPLYDPATGNVIGIVNMTIARNTRESALPQPTGIAYAVPVRHLREVIAGIRP
jgi:serine protease Do